MQWKSWKYKNLTFLLLLFIFAVSVGGFEPFHNFLFNAGYIAAFVAGAIFVSTFTAPIAAAILLILAEKFPLINLGVVAAFGAVVSDFTIFRLIKDNLAKEMEPIYEAVAESKFKKTLKSKHFRWLYPIIGAILIFSPLPNQVGTNLMGIHKLKTQQFIIFSAVTNILGIIFILCLSFIIKP